MRILTLCSLFTGLITSLVLHGGDSPLSARPNKQQLHWYDTGLFAMVCHGITTYSTTGRGYGEDSPKLFNPASLSTDQIAAVLAGSGIRGLILAAKSHDGFCLWPTKTTTYSIAHTPWHEGRGDLVREYADAARKHRLQFGVFCSTWDRNNAAFGTPAYPALLQDQLCELLTNYGTLATLSLSCHPGGEGFYGGAREKRVVAPATSYAWDKIWQLVREQQPTTCILSDFGGDCRRVLLHRNMENMAAPSSVVLRSTLTTPIPVSADTTNSTAHVWLPTEYRIPLRQQWYWHPDSEDTLLTPKQLLQAYFNSVGRGGVLTIGVSPNQEGQLAPADCEVLKQFGSALNSLFQHNLAKGGKAVASSTYKPVTKEGELNPHDPAFVMDPCDDTWWRTAPGVKEATLTLEFPTQGEFNVVRVKENINMGERVQQYAVDIFQNGKWIEYAQGTHIGNCALIQGSRVVSDRARLRIVAATAEPHISEFGIYKIPAALEDR